MVSDGAGWPTGELGRHLESLRRERPECFLTQRRLGLGDDENRLSRQGADSIVARLPGWGVEREGRSLRRRIELDTAAEAVAWLAAVQAFVGGDRWSPGWRCQVDDRHLELAIRAGTGEGLPVWLVFLTERLERLQTPEPAPCGPADREELAALTEETQPPWRLSRDRSALLGCYTFASPLRAITFTCLAGALAVLQSDAVRVTLEIRSREVRLRLSEPAGSGVTPTVLLASYDLSAQAGACGAGASEAEEPATTSALREAAR